MAEQLIVAPLSVDERAVLMIAVGGGSMIPIGRWEEPIKSLAVRGFLRRLDDVNYVITDAGKKASEDAESDAFNALFKARRSYGS